MASELVHTFLRNVEALGATWELEANPVAARLALLRYLRELNRHVILAWHPDALPLPGLAEAMADVGLSLVSSPRRHLDPDMVVGLTSADAGLADTGSLVLSLASGRAWAPALVTLHHVALLPASRLYPNLAAWRKAWAADRPSDLASSLIITGPSVTEDIELHPHRGMFGPGHQHIILYEESERI